jgi:hypothetical protein
MRVTAAALSLACLAGAGFDAAASASFPGRNGRIVFEVRSVAGREDPCFTPSCQESRLGAVAPRGGRRLPFDPCTDPVECEDRDPAIAPGGGRIAFERLSYSGEPLPLDFPDLEYLAVTRLRGARVRLLAEPARDPAWAPSGRWIAFARDDGIYRIRPDGRGLRRIVEGSAHELDWSVRGVLVFTRYRRLRSDLYTVRPDGSGLRRLTRDGGSREASWSPDGRSLVHLRLVFVKGEIEPRRLDLVIRRGGDAPIRVGSGVAPVWSPDGSRLAFIRRNSIWTMSTAGTSARRLIGLGERNYVGSPAWRPVPERRGRYSRASTTIAPNKSAR